MRGKSTSGPPASVIQHSPSSRERARCLGDPTTSRSGARPTVTRVALAVGMAHREIHADAHVASIWPPSWASVHMCWRLVGALSGGLTKTVWRAASVAASQGMAERRTARPLDVPPARRHPPRLEIVPVGWNYRDSCRERLLAPAVARRATHGCDQTGLGSPSPGQTGRSPGRSRTSFRTRMRRPSTE